MNIAILDDERATCLEIAELIEKKSHDNNINIYTSGEQLLRAKKAFDIIFIDIQLGGINGIDTAKQIRQTDKGVILIFVTAIKEYVFDAFDVCAFHYLLKPIDEKKFCEVFDKAVAQLSEKSQSQIDTLFIKTKKRSFTIPKDNIVYIESHAKKIEIHTFDDVIEVYSSMKEIEEKLGFGFYRCHRGYIVNLGCITEYETNSITLGNDKVYLAKDKYREFVRIYMRYLRNGGVYRV